MKILVTGGAGYVGSVAAADLIKAGHEVIVLDSLVRGHRASVPDAAMFVRCDLANTTALRMEFSRHKPQAVMHFAANCLVGESMSEPFKHLDDNVVCGINLIRASVESGVRKFVLSSTANLFDCPGVATIVEGAEPRPVSPYGESKLILERMLHWMDRIHGLRYAVLRYFNAAGATRDRGEDHEPETHLIPVVLQAALGKRDRVLIYGGDYDTPDGTCIRDYVHVADLAQAHSLAIGALETRSATYHLGNGNDFSVKEVIETARRVTGKAIKTEIVPRRPGDPAKLVADSTRIRRELGWAPVFADLDLIVRSAWNWMIEHPNGYSTVPGGHS